MFGSNMRTQGEEGTLGKAGRRMERQSLKLNNKSMFLRLDLLIIIICLICLGP